MGRKSKTEKLKVLFKYAKEWLAHGFSISLSLPISEKLFKGEKVINCKLTPKKWSDNFLKVCGSWEGDFPPINDLKSTKRDDLE